MTERLHNQVGRKAQTSQILELITCHWTSGVLAADCRHEWLTVGTWTYALSLWQATGPAHHFLCQGKALAGVFGVLVQADKVCRARVERLAGAAGHPAAYT